MRTHSIVSGADYSPPARLALPMSNPLGGLNPLPRRRVVCVGVVRGPEIASLCLINGLWPLGIKRLAGGLGEK